MEATVNDIIKVMDGIAPPNLAEPWDNVGLLVGRSSNTVRLPASCPYYRHCWYP